MREAYGSFVSMVCIEIGGVHMQANASATGDSLWGATGMVLETQSMMFFVSLSVYSLL